MTDHADCRQAMVESRRPGQRTWHCVECHRLLATMELRAGGVEPADGLRLLPGDHDGMARFGRPQQVLIGRQPNARTGTPAPTRRLPFYAYCPRPGCGAGQHVGT
jgi:hypothetical protein